MTAIYFEELSKAGHPLLMLHGWGQSSSAFRPLAELLSRHANVFLLDLPGFGESELPPSDWGTEDYARRLLEFMDKHKIERADLLGHSFGGRVAMRMVSLAPERIRRIVLVSSAGLKRKRTVPQRLRMLWIRILRTSVKSTDRLFGCRLYQDKFIKRFGSQDYLNAGPLRSILVRTVNEDLAGIACSIKAPTLLLWGTADKETPLEMGERLHGMIENSRLIPLPGKGHDSFIGAGAHLLASYIIPFFTENEAAEKGHRDA